MQLEIRSRGFPLTDALRTHCERRLGFSLSRFGARLGRVVLRLSDVNGPKGGPDKRCHLVAAVNGGRQVSIERVGPDLYAAVDLVADRAALAIQRELERVRTHWGSAA